MNERNVDVLVQEEIEVLKQFLLMYLSFLSLETFIINFELQYRFTYKGRLN